MIMTEVEDKWCHTCGAKLYTVPWKGAYNSDTGEQYTGFHYKCPNNAWYKFWHDEFYHFSA